MKIDQAIEILKDELHHTELHMTAKGKAPEYYEEMGNYCEALKMAIEVLRFHSQERPQLYLPNGKRVYLTQGHIDALLDYERSEILKEICRKMREGET